MLKINCVRMAYHTKVRLSKSINSLLVLVLLAGMMFPAVGPTHAADTSHTMNQTGLCVAPDRKDDGMSRVFLPFIGNLVQNVKVWVKADALSILQKPAIAPINDIEYWDQAIAARSLDYEVGKTYVYLYDYNLEVKNLGRTRDGTETAEGQTMLINTYVDMTILSKNEDGAVSAEVSMRDPFICSSNGPNNQTILKDDSMIKALAAPMRFTQAKNGAISEILVLPDSPVAVKNMQKGVINFLQVTIQESGDAYAATEQGIQGAYSANYQLAEQSDGLHITKSIGQNDYTTLTSLGERPASLEMNTTFRAVLGNENSVLTSIELVEDHQSADGETENPTNEGGGLDGLSVWSTMETSGSMKLEEVVDAPAGRAQEAVNAIYQADSFSGDLSEVNPENNGIDLSQVNLDTEFDKFEAEPDNPRHFARILQLSKAKGGEAVVAKIGERLAQQTTGSALTNDYIDFLGEIGTPQAQDYLNGIFNNANRRSANIMSSITITNQQQALYNMVVLTEPVSQTVGTLQQLSTDEGNELKSTAQKVLSSAIDELDDAELSEELLQDLLADLDQAADVDELIDVLYSIGNLGLESSLDTLTLYITDSIEVNGEQVTDEYDILDINATAYEAMVDIPGFAAEDILIDALLDDTLDDWLWEIIVDILLDRDVYEDTALSQEAYDILMEFLGDWYDADSPGFPRAPDAIDAEFKRSWNWAFGGEKVGIRTPGSFYVAGQPQSANYGGGIYLFAQQQVNAYVWNPNDNINIASADVTSSKRGANQEFRVRVSIANRLIALNHTETLSCSDPNRRLNLLNKNFEFFTVSFSLLASTGVPITLELEASGDLSLDLFAGSNTCAGADPNIYAGIEPSAAIIITGRIYFDVFLARAGGEIQGDLMRTGLPFTGTLSSVNSETTLQACFDVKTVTRPLSITIRVYAENFDFSKLDYVRFFELDIYSYSLPYVFTHELLKYCVEKGDGTERLIDGIWGGYNFFINTTSCGNDFAGFAAGHQLLNAHWQPADGNYNTLAMCRGNGFPVKNSSYLLSGNVGCGLNASKMGVIPGSAFTNATSDIQTGGMTVCQLFDTFNDGEMLESGADYYLTPNLVNVCGTGHSLAGHLYPDKFTTGTPQWNHFGMSVCKR